MSDDLDDHLATLVRLRATGPDVYDRALQAARVAVAKVVLVEAHRLSASARRIAQVIPFPSRARPGAERPTPKREDEP